jgi:hypothetical protein
MDISEAMRNLAQHMQDAMQSDPLLQSKISRREYLWHSPGDGWDINELFSSGSSQKSRFSGKTCEQGKSCQNTVTLHGGCYKTWAVNYWLWGYLYQAAGLSLAVALNYVKSYRGTKYLTGTDEDESIARGNASRLFFTEVGYNISPTPPPQNSHNYKECNPCKEKYKGTLTARVKMGKNLFYEFTNRRPGYTRNIYNVG